MRDRVLRRVGQVPSPTPMIGVLGDSTNVTLKLCGIRLRCLAAMTPAANHPAVPPPTITILLTACTIDESSTAAADPYEKRGGADGGGLSTPPLSTLHSEARPQCVTAAVGEHVQ